LLKQCLAGRRRELCRQGKMLSMNVNVLNGREKEILSKKKGLEKGGGEGAPYKRLRFEEKKADKWQRT